MRHTTQHPITSSVDLRDMLRQYLIERALNCMDESAQRRKNALTTGEIDAYQESVRKTIADFYGKMPFGADAPQLEVTPVSQFEKRGYRIENVLFDSFPGWQVNATVYVPLGFAPPYPAVVIPVGHSGKQFESYQFPAQYFARNGYLAVLFDPPGQASEKKTGNDHFVDGVRCYLVGETSSRYFVADALRCVDYVYSRADVDTRNGVAMTGVSGGGTTTLLASVLDERITVMGPSCCLSSRADLDIVQAYAGCPETAMFGRYADLIDETDFLSAIAPKPTLLMAGAKDEVFRIDDTRALANEVAAFFEALGQPEKFVFHVDPGGHAYTLAQAHAFTLFMDKWLRNQPVERAVPDKADFSLDPYDEMRCHPRQDVNMRTLTLLEAEMQEKNRRPVDVNQIRDFVGAHSDRRESLQGTQGDAGEPFLVWTHRWQQILLKPEPGIELPATFLCGAARPTGAILHFDDQHRDRLLERHGILMRALGFLDGRESESPHSLLSVDVRGWGDTKPALYPYELAGWGGIDRFVAYISAALGDPLMAQRVRDGLAALDYLRSRPEVDPAKIVVTGCGLGGIVALHVAAIGGAHGVVTWDAPISFKTLLEADKYTWPADAFWPNALVHSDLPELALSLTFPTAILNPRDGGGVTLVQAQIDALNTRAGRGVYTLDADVVKTIKTILALDS